MNPAVREAGGVKVRFAEAGQGGSETAVLTFPWPESLFAFRKVWDRLAERFHLVAIDLPGFGQSEARLDLFLHQHLPNSRMDLLPAGHFAWEETPDLYGDVLVEWLDAGYRQSNN